MNTELGFFDYVLDFLKPVLPCIYDFHGRTGNEPAPHDRKDDGLE
ncbi:MAG: hypothetical protein WBF53_14495 [Litorimonas sp.]